MSRSYKKRGEREEREEKGREKIAELCPASDHWYTPIVIKKKMYGSEAGKRKKGKGGKKKKKEKKERHCLAWKDVLPSLMPFPEEAKEKLKKAGERRKGKKRGPAAQEVPFSLLCSAGKALRARAWCRRERKKEKGVE